MILKEWIRAEYNCPKCDKLHSIIDVNQYNKDGKDRTSIVMKCAKCRTYVATVDVFEPEKTKYLTEEKPAASKRRGRTSKNMSVGVGTVSEPS